MTVELNATQQALVTDNVNLAHWVAKHYQPRSLQEEYASSALLGLVKAAHGYDPARGIKFATYAATCMHNEIRMYLRKQRRHAGVSSLELPLATDNKGHQLLLGDTLPDPAPLPDTVVTERLTLAALRSAAQRLPYKQRVALELYHVKGLSQAEVARHLGCEQCYVSRLLKQLYRTLHDDLHHVRHVRQVHPTRERMSILRINTEDYLALKQEHGKDKAVAVLLGCSVQQLYNLKQRWRTQGLLPKPDKHQAPEHPKGEHPKGEHPKGEQAEARRPKSEHPKAEQPKAEHPKGEHLSDAALRAYVAGQELLLAQHAVNVAQAAPLANKPEANQPEANQPEAEPSTPALTLACPRCGTTHGVALHALGRVEGWGQPTHWGTCETTQEPVLVTLRCS